MKLLTSLSFLACGLIANVAHAKTCDVAIEGNDAMQFNLKEIDIAKGCDEMKINLKHSGKLPKAAMGHNWVLAKTADMPDIVSKGAGAGADKGFIPDDKRIIAHTKLIGGGESDTTTFKVKSLKKTESYSFFCTFPGHYNLMNGKIVFK